ncbi:MAG: LytTR family DNA-binding domain-containing protein [Melioribacteraceae bacterium]|nr:LytTR family DNA-binding domain-containing protein [Melioribacteraceae bacterium]MCF8265859.1 LytTR family DNA-binding domain-containing protein [Melioribacteraceae bacterium]
MLTVLLIEDDSEIRKMVRDYLELQKFTVITAEDGSKGIELAEKFIPDLIICDIMMPVKNGFEVKESLAKKKVTDLIPFIYLTAQSDRTDIRKGMELGADDYLFKPFKIAELSNAIETQMEKREKLITEYSKKEEVKEKKDLTYKEHILLKVNGIPKFIKISSIVYVMADEKYTRVKIESGEKLIISKSLKEWEESLPSSHFIRIHRSYIVNIEFIGKVVKWFNRSYKVSIKNDDEPLFISRRYYSKLKDIFEG